MPTWDARSSACWNSRRRSEGSAILLSASLPLAMRAKLLSAFELGIGGFSQEQRNGARVSGSHGLRCQRSVDVCDTGAKAAWKEASRTFPPISNIGH